MRLGINAARFGGSPQTLGLLSGGLAAGGLVGSVLSGPAGRVSRKARAMLVTVVIWGAALAVFGLANSLWLALPMVALASAADTTSVIFRGSIVQLVTPDRCRGRVTAVDYVVGAGGPALGNVRAGAVAELELLATYAGLSPLEAILSNEGEGQAKFFGWSAPFPGADVLTARHDAAEEMTDTLCAAGLAQALDADPALSADAASALAFAAEQLGTPYRWGGPGDGGFACSGLTQAAWRVSEDSPASGWGHLPLAGADPIPADIDVASAAFWAADAGHRVAHTIVHVHGGVGVDTDHPVHRYFLAAKETEFALGGATGQLRRIGRELAETPA